MPRLRLGDRLRGGAAAFHGSWANPDLRRAQLCFAGAWTAEWALTVGLGVLAFQHGGAGAVGAVSLLRMLPAAVITPFASVYGDRWRRERILVVVTGGRGAALVLMAVLASLDVAVAFVYALSVVATITGVLFRPVHSALMPSLCRTPTELAGANVVRGMLDSLSTLLGPVLAAVLLATSGPGAVFAACAVASLWAAWLMTGVAPDAMATSGPHGAAEPAAPEGIVADFIDGLLVVGRDRHLTVLVALAEVQTLMRGALTVFTVVVAIDLLDMGESGVGILSAAVGAGAVLGSVAVSMSRGQPSAGPLVRTRCRALGPSDGLDRHRPRPGRRTLPAALRRCRERLGRRRDIHAGCATDPEDDGRPGVRRDGGHRGPLASESVPPSPRSRSSCSGCAARSWRSGWSARSWSP